MRLKNILLTSILGMGTTLLMAQDLEAELATINERIATQEASLKEMKQQKEGIQLQVIQKQLHQSGLPKLEEGEELIEHEAMMLVYSEEHEQAKWVAHIISKEIVNGAEGRTNDFREDPLVKTGSAVEKDYFLKTKISDDEYEYDGFGYDRGHLAPSADFRWSLKALSESYFYSNMSPQLPEFNREGWAKLEGMMRGYVYENNTDIFVVTGPVLKDGLKPIERSVNKVSIPEHFFKVAYDPVNKRGIAFLYPHEGIDKAPEHYAVSIDELEEFSGIDFFADLPDDIENDIESQLVISEWLPEREKNDVLPLTNLGKDRLNTLEAKDFVDYKGKVTVCGTVVSTHRSKKGNVFLNLDKSFPNQVFSVTIWSSNMIHFDYAPEEVLMGKKVCIKGKLTEREGTPTMNVEHSKQIEILED